MVNRWASTNSPWPWWDETKPVRELNVVSIEYEPEFAERPAFLVEVENNGRLHLALAGELALVAEHGRPQRAVAGHGRWLMPDSTDHLRFPLQSLPEAGLYDLQLQIQTGDPEAPFQFQQVLELK